jgi:hypothetical protein
MIIDYKRQEIPSDKFEPIENVLIDNYWSFAKD